MAGRVPLVELPEAVRARLHELGVDRPSNLYRALANQPDLVAAWVDFAWTLRLRCRTPRALRELVIIRMAQLAQSDYEWKHHLAMALGAGVTPEQVSELSRWRESAAFTDAQRAALELADAVTTGNVPDAVNDLLSIHFDDAARVELVLTAGFYAMVARVLEALRIPLEQEGGL